MIQASYVASLWVGIVRRREKNRESEIERDRGREEMTQFVAGCSEFDIMISSEIMNASIMTPL